MTLTASQIADVWKPHDGGECPVDGPAAVEVIIRAGIEDCTSPAPFTPDVVAWAEDVCRDWDRNCGYDKEPRMVKAACQILAAMGRLITLA